MPRLRRPLHNVCVCVVCGVWCVVCVVCVWVCVCGVCVRGVCVWWVWAWVSVEAQVYVGAREWKCQSSWNDYSLTSLINRLTIVFYTPNITALHITPWQWPHRIVYQISGHILLLCLINAIRSPPITANPHTRRQNRKPDIVLPIPIRFTAKRAHICRMICQRRPTRMSSCNGIMGGWGGRHRMDGIMGGSGGGSRGSGPPFLAHVVGCLTLGPKLDTLLDPLFLLVDLGWTPPPFKNPGSAPVIFSTVIYTS